MATPEHFVKSLRFEDLGKRVGPHRNKDHDVLNPDWSTVEKAIRALNGKERSYVMLSPDQESPGSNLLTVGGGEGGAYISFYWDGDEYNLINPQCTEEGSLRVLLGEHSIRQKNEIVGLEAVLMAARTYFERGVRSSSLTWTRQEP